MIDVSVGRKPEVLEVLHAFLQGDFHGKSLHARCAVEASEARYSIEDMLRIRSRSDGTAVYEHQDV